MPFFKGTNNKEFKRRWKSCVQRLHQRAQNEMCIRDRYNTLGQRKFRTIQILLYEILMITVPALVGAGILTLGLLNRFSVNIFKYFVEFCEISNFQKSFSLVIWNFEMNIWQFVYRIGLLEISVILITMIGSCIYANKGLRTLRNNQERLCGIIFLM